MRILVAEGDVALAEFLKEQLESSHYTVEIACDCAALVAAIEAKRYDLAFIDVGCATTDVLGRIQSLRPDLLLVALSGDDDPTTQIRWLDAGADDFVTKPFYFSVLMARFRALLRRRNDGSTAVLSLGDLELNRVRRTVKRNGCSIDLTQKEFALLEFLMERPMQPVSRALIARNAWKLEDDSGSANTVDVYVNYIRKKLDSYGDRPVIRTVRGVGYQIGGAESGHEERHAAKN